MTKSIRSFSRAALSSSNSWSIVSDGQVYTMTLRRISASVRERLSSVDAVGVSKSSIMPIVLSAQGKAASMTTSCSALVDSVKFFKFHS